MNVKRKMTLFLASLLCASVALCSCGGDSGTETVTSKSDIQSETVGTSYASSGSESGYTDTSVTATVSDSATDTASASSDTEDSTSGSSAFDSETAANDNTSAASGTTEASAAAVTVLKDEYGSFILTTTDGIFSRSGSVYTIKKAGTYTLSGTLDGQIIVSAGENDEVVLEMNGADVSCSTDSPIKIISADKAEISAKADTVNTVNDNRSAKTADEETKGEGAVYARTDLKFKGTGSLTVTGNYNNGIHTTKDLSIQKLTLKVTAVNNAIKGNDSVSVKSGSVTAVSKSGDGIKTENTDADKNNATRGDVVFTGGTVTVYAAGDGIQSAHDFIMSKDSEGNAASVYVYTGTYSSYTASGASNDSQKGVKVKNELNIESGKIEIKSYDDGLHADYGTAFTDGTKGAGTINISGGTVTVRVSTSTQKTSGNTGTQRFSANTIAARPGRPGGGGGGRPGGGGGGGFPGQQGATGSDGIHADYKLNITGGTVKIESAYEGLEANVINVSGGKTFISATDDGMNACKGVTTPQINVSGGYLDVTVPVNGDSDGIDSNGSYTQTGGIVITRGPGQRMMAALDTDSGATISGGTLIVLGYANVRTSGVSSYSLSLHSAGDHTVLIDGQSYTISNSYSYSRTTCYSSVPVSAG